MPSFLLLQLRSCLLIPLQTTASPKCRCQILTGTRKWDYIILGFTGCQSNLDPILKCYCLFLKPNRSDIYTYISDLIFLVAQRKLQNNLPALRTASYLVIFLLSGLLNKCSTASMEKYFFLVPL